MFSELIYLSTKHQNYTECLVFEDIPDKTFEDQLDEFKIYAERMAFLNSTFGYINIVIGTGYIGYIAVALCMKIQHTFMVWSFLLTMTFLAYLVGVAMIIYNDIIDGLCNFWLKLIYGCEIIIIFKLTAVMGYFTRNLIYDIYEFAAHRSLLSEAAKKKRDVFIVTTSMIFGGFLIIYAILSGYYVEAMDYDRFIKLNSTAVYI